MTGAKLTGSALTRFMLNKNNKPVWCTVSDNSDEEAMHDIDGHDFTAIIASSNKEGFRCVEGTQWAFAVPIKIVSATEE